MAAPNAALMQQLLIAMAPPPPAVALSTNDIRMNAMKFSSSFLHFGTDFRPISKNIKVWALDTLVPECDAAGLSHLNNLQVDRLCYILFSMRPDTKVSSLGLTGAVGSEFLEVMRQARVRTVRINGDLN